MKKKLLGVILLIAIAGCTPTEPNLQLLSTTEAIQTLETQVATDSSAEIRYELSQAYFHLDVRNAKNQATLDQNLPYFLSDPSNTACLAIMHGFAASPYEIMSLTEQLYAKNINVYAIRLAGHGSSVEKFQEVNYQDWVQSLELPMKALEANCENIFVAGLSFGGTLAQHAATTYDLQGIITISAPITFHDWRILQAGKLAWLIKETKRELQEGEVLYYYDTIPSKQLGEMATLIKKTKRALPDITTPILILQSLKDMRVEPSSAAYIHDNIASPNKKIIMYEAGKHVLARDPMNATVAHDMYQFIQETIQ